MFFVFSCEKETLIEYEYSGYENKLIVQGIMSNKEGIIVCINKSLPPLTVCSDTIDRTVNGAKVMVYVNNMPNFFLEEIDEGIFTSHDTFTPQHDIPYYIKVIAPDYDTVTSSVQYLTAPVQIDTVFYFENGLFSYLSVKFFDFEINKNYYYYKKHIFHNGDEQADDYFNPLNEYYPLFDPEEIIYDDSFNGSWYNLQDQIFTNYWNYSDTVKADSVMVKLYSLSYDMVKYLESLNDWSYSKDDMWLENPVMIYSNIINGYGIFASYNESCIILNIEP